MFPDLLLFADVVSICAQVILSFVGCGVVGHTVIYLFN